MSSGASLSQRFQSTHPARGATVCTLATAGSRRDFNPRTPRGVRLLQAPQKLKLSIDFNPRTPRGVRRLPVHQHRHTANFNPRTPRGVRLTAGSQINTKVRKISIHAPREGCDCTGTGAVRRTGDFNPRTPRGVRLPADFTVEIMQGNFNPRTPRGVRQQQEAN